MVDAYLMNTGSDCYKGWRASLQFREMSELQNRFATALLVHRLARASI